MKRFLLAPLALGALLLSTVAASAAPRPPHHLSPREQARWEAAHRPAPRPMPAPHPAYQYHRGEPLPTHRVTRRPIAPAPAGHYHR